MQDKINRAKELLASQDWDNYQFWEAKQLLSATPDCEMGRVMVQLLIRWTDQEENRIASGSNKNLSDEEYALLDKKWPIN